MPEEYQPATASEVNQTRKLLGKGCQPWEVSQHIGRSEQEVRHALEDDPDLASKLKVVKKGRWSALEVDHFEKLFANEDYAPRMIAQPMGRTLPSVFTRMRRTAEAVDRRRRRSSAVVVISLPMRSPKDSGLPTAGSHKQLVLRHVQKRKRSE